MNKLKQKCLGVNKQCYFVLYLWDSLKNKPNAPKLFPLFDKVSTFDRKDSDDFNINLIPVSYTHLRAHETGRNLVCRLLLEKKKKTQTKNNNFL